MQPANTNQISHFPEHGSDAELESGALYVMPLDRYLDDLVAKSAREVEQFRVERPAIELLAAEDGLRRLLAERLEAALRIRNIREE